MSPVPHTIWVEVLSGALEGTTFTCRDPQVTVGRDVASVVRFEPDADLEVSSHHALLLRASHGWMVEDLGSTNGTFVNGERVLTTHPLDDRDEIEFGVGGPRTVIHFADPRLRATSPSPVRAGVRSGARSISGQGSRLRTSVVMGALLAVAVVSGALWVSRANQRAWSTERDRLTEVVDSLIAFQSSLESELESTREETADSLQMAREEAQRLRDRLAAVDSRPDRSEVEELRRRLQDAQVLVERQQLAASLDFDRIRRDVEPAVAMIWSEAADGTVSTGTAFSISRDGLLLTNRHVVAPERGGEGRRLAIQFAGSSQVWAGTITDTHDDVDLAWVRVAGIVGDVPRLDGFNSRADTLPAGSAVAIVGFPLGGSPGAEDRAARRRAVVSAGVLLGGGADGLRIQGYGAEGASGSPVVDRDGRLIGLIYGADLEGVSPVLLAVPIRFANDAR